jgi:hypothetical protein
MKSTGGNGMVGREWQSTVERCSFWTDIRLARYVVSVLIDFSILQSISKGYGTALLEMARADGRGSGSARKMNRDVSRKSRRPGLKRMKRAEKGAWESVTLVSNIAVQFERRSYS